MSTTRDPEAVLPPHLEQAPSVPTVPEEKPAPAPKVHRLRPVHVAVLSAAAEKATGIVDEARAMVAADLGVSGVFRVQPDPETGAMLLVEQPS
jgi:hypothetical protein